jgi:hypothetical protein
MKNAAQSKNEETKEVKEEKEIKENYHAYDATSRSVPLALSSTLSGAAPFSGTVTREDVVIDGAR